MHHDLATGVAVEPLRLEARLRAVCDLQIPDARDRAGRREYDGVVPDLSAEGVRAALDRLGGPRRENPAEEAHLAAAEVAHRVRFGELALHRRSPRLLIGALDVTSYDRPYASTEHRLEARRRHLSAWTDAVEAALPTLDAVPAATARAMLGSAHGLRSAIDQGVAPAGVAHDHSIADLALLEQAGSALERLVEHLEAAAERSEVSVALGRGGLATLLGAGQATTVELGRLEERADAERQRLLELLADGCAGVDATKAPAAVIADLLADHPDADGVLVEARELTEETIDFTREHALLDRLDGECLVEPSPPSMRWATALLSWPGVAETDGPSRYYVTPPDPGWSPARQREWLASYSRTTLPATTAHEVAPGHFAHGRMLRRTHGDVARTLFSSAFVEGWAHYGEELLLECGFRSSDPRYQIGVALKALLRVTRLAVSLGVHAGSMELDEAVQRFRSDAHLETAVAEAEAARATHDPTYGRYTWGKLLILDARAASRARAGSGFTLQGFHHEMLDRGAPPLGLLDQLGRR